jgi:hypothetical protein
VITAGDLSVEHVATVCTGPVDNIDQVSFYASAGTANVRYRQNYSANCQNDVFIYYNSSNWLIEFNYFAGNWSSPQHHGEPIDVFSPNIGSTFRYNIVKNCAGTGCMVTNGVNNSCAIDNWDIYGNVFDGNTGGNGVIVAAAQLYICNTRIYNNTVLNNSGGAFVLQANVGVTQASGNIVRNNLLYKSNAGMPRNSAGVIDHDYNSVFDGTGALSEPHGQYASGNPFVNPAAGRYELTFATDPADDAIGSAYRTDADGKIRGADGVWDRGAYEYVGAKSTAPAPPQNLSVVAVQ